MIDLFIDAFLNSLLLEQREEIVTQSEILEKRNHDITDSINYAKKIQDSILPTKEELNKTIPNSFVFYKPKDIVSGDFYWLKENKSKTKFFFSVADCTGHGVPGAFMSILSSSFFERAVKSSEFETPDKALGYVRFKIIEALHQNDNSQKDGLDAGIFCYDRKSLQISFSSSFIPMYIVRNNEKPLKNVLGEIIEPKESVNSKYLYTIKGTNQPVSYYYGNEKDFKLNIIQLEPEDEIYMTSDGFVDMFGGTDGDTKYTPKRFRKLLLSLSDSPSVEKQKIFENEYKKWIGNNIQIDDICVFGMKI